MIIELDYIRADVASASLSHLARLSLHELFYMRICRRDVEFRGFMNYSLRAPEAKVFYFYISLSFSVTPFLIQR